MAVPSGHKGSVLNKYGYKTQTSGNVKVGPCYSRAKADKGMTVPLALCCCNLCSLPHSPPSQDRLIQAVSSPMTVVSRCCLCGLQVRAHMVLQAGAAGGSSPSKAAAKQATAAAAAARQRRSLSLAVVLERARSRLQVRGGHQAQGTGCGSCTLLYRSTQPPIACMNRCGISEHALTGLVCRRRVVVSWWCVRACWCSRPPSPHSRQTPLSTRAPRCSSASLQWWVSHQRVALQRRSSQVATTQRPQRQRPVFSRSVLASPAAAASGLGQYA